MERIATATLLAATVALLVAPAAGASTAEADADADASGSVDQSVSATADADDSPSAALTVTAEGDLANQEQSVTAPPGGPNAGEVVDDLLRTCVPGANTDLICLR